MSNSYHKTHQFHPRYLPKRNENLRPLQNLHVNITRNIVRNNQNVETTQTAINLWVEKQNGHGMKYYLQKKNEGETDSYYSMDKPKIHYTEWKKPVAKGHILYGPIYMKIQIGKSTEVKRSKKLGVVRAENTEEQERLLMDFFLGWWKCSKIR